MVKRRRKKIGILTAGGDCPGLNAAIRGVGKAALLEYGMEVVGISSGFLGLIEREFCALKEEDLSGIITLGGTILGTSREKPFKHGQYNEYVRSKPEIIKENYLEMGLDALICIGGNGTMKTAAKLANRGMNIIGMPKTIDNDVWGTDETFGFDSAFNIATEAIDRIHTTANSHKRIMVIEVMGHHAGWLALYSGISGGGDVILIPEIPYDLDNIAEYLVARSQAGKPYSIVVVAEGIDRPEKKKKKSAGRYIAQQLQKRTDMIIRETILGYIQRGGTPSARDRILATRFGAHAAQCAAMGKYGMMVALQGNSITEIPLDEVAGKLKLVTEDLPMMRKARAIGTCFGDQKIKSP